MRKNYGNKKFDALWLSKYIKIADTLNLKYNAGGRT
jgi:hypothetical protein